MDAVGKEKAHDRRAPQRGPTIWQGTQRGYASPPAPDPPVRLGSCSPSPAHATLRPPGRPGMTLARRNFTRPPPGPGTAGSPELRSDVERQGLGSAPSTNVWSQSSSWIKSQIRLPRPPPALMRIDRATHRLGPEDAALDRSRIEQNVSREVPQPASKPVAHGHRESCSGDRGCGPGSRTQSVLEDALRGRRVELDRGGERRGHLHESVIEQR